MATQTVTTTPKPRDSRSRRFWKNVLAILVLVGSFLLVAASGGLGFVSGLWLSFQNLPDVRNLDRYSPSETTKIYDIKGRLMASIHGEANRSVVDLKAISPNLINGVLAIEDDQFYRHNGVRLDTIIRAAITNFQEGRAAQGGSTLTQQLVKNLFLTPRKTLNRKIAEAFLSLELEKNFTKDQILKMYLNQVYWGHNNYGAQTAALTYFNKPASDLGLAEGAMMAGLLRAPENYSPFRNYPKAKERQALVLDRMAELGFATREDVAKAKKEPLKLGRIRGTRTQLSYANDYALKELQERFGEEALRKGGLKVQTTLDLDLQKIAESSVRSGIAKLRGRGASQMALISVDPRTGFIKAMVGGVDFKKSQFNRATQARRQPGSSFKPFVYYTAFARRKYTPDSFIGDNPVRYGSYSPRNYDGSFWGGMSIRRAVQFSRNIPAIKVASSAGIKNVIDTSKVLGMRANWQPNYSVALGSGDVTPLELAGAYSSFANGGFGVKPSILLQVTDSQDNVLLRNIPERRLVLDPKAVDMTNDVLRAVVTAGTGTRAQLPDKRPVAGKTGTTSDFRDAWFVGYVPQMVTVMWVGNDNYSPLRSGTAGGVYVTPIWSAYMAQALKNQPVIAFPTAKSIAAVLPPDPALKTSPDATTALPPEEVQEAKPRKRRRARVEATEPAVPYDETKVQPAPPVEAVPVPEPSERPQRESQVPEADLKPAEPPKEKFIP